jgi:hypothetical protein
MSMKRTKQRSSGTAKEQDKDPFAKPVPPDPIWEEVTSHADATFLPYVMSSRFAKGQLIDHSKFGKGVVTAIEGANIVVLFKDGKKKLGHALS